MSGIPSWAVRGAKVVCISANGYWSALDDGSAPSMPPVKGQVYTIADAEVIGGLCYLTLGECDAEECFSIRNFAPVVGPTLEQDIAAHFSHHLRTDQRVPEKA